MDVTAYVGETVHEEEATALQSRVNALGWQLQTRPAGNGQVRIVSITAPAAPEDEQGNSEEFSSPIQIEPAPGSGLARRDRVLVAAGHQPALSIAG